MALLTNGTMLYEGDLANPPIVWNRPAISALIAYLINQGGGIQVNYYWG